MILYTHRVSDFYILGKPDRKRWVYLIKAVDFHSPKCPPHPVPHPRHQKLNRLKPSGEEAGKSILSLSSYFILRVTSSSTQSSVVFYTEVIFCFILLFYCWYCLSQFFPERYPRHRECSTMEPPLIFSEVVVFVHLTEEICLRGFV